MDARLFTFGAVGGGAAGRLADRAAEAAVSARIDLCIVLPFLMDTLGNALDLYNAVVWFDDLMHYLTWIPWVVAFGLLLVTYAPPVPRWALFGLVLGFGAVTHICGSWRSTSRFIRGGPEEATAYTDTLGDLTLSLTGSLIGALIVAVFAPPRPRAGGSPPARIGRGLDVSGSRRRGRHAAVGEPRRVRA